MPSPVSDTRQQSLARTYGPGWNDVFGFLAMGWPVEIAAALAGALPIGRFKDAREPGGARTSGAD
jgi:hypothetical protein